MATKPPDKSFQFDLQSLFWLIVTVGLALAYVRPFGHQVVAEGFLVAVAAAICGGIVGWFRGRIGDIVYWSVLGATFSFVSVVHVTLDHWTLKYAWPVAGAAVGCAVGTIAEKRLMLPIVVGGTTAFITLGTYAAVLYRYNGRLVTFDLVISLLIGSFFGGLVVMLRSIQRRNKLRPDATATMLMASIVAGNVLSRIIMPSVLAACLVLQVAGCGQSSPSVDSKPFEAAIADYLKKNDMALKLKAVKEGPTVTDGTATMTASMTHAELGGPSVEWRIQFENSGGNNWIVVSHED